MCLAVHGQDEGEVRNQLSVLPGALQTARQVAAAAQLNKPESITAISKYCLAGD